MALFDEGTVVVPPEPSRRPRRARAGLWALASALVLLLVISLLPSGSVIEQPGPVYDTIGTVRDEDGDEVPLIAISGAETYETDGALDLLTVEVVGNRERTPSWFELLVAWLDPSRAVVPLDLVFPEGQSTQERNDQNAALMVDSQTESTAAALAELGYDVDPRLVVYSVAEGSAAEGALESGDVIVSVDGQGVDDVEAVRAAVAAGEGEPVRVVVDRSGDEVETTVEPQYDEQSAGWLLGVTLMSDYDFPIDVEFALENVGGPSAGMMFSLGIIDMLTPGELTGGENIAGTGTIDAEGTVGPIGGIRQKLHGARDAGAEYFLAPDANCGEVVGNVPGGLRVFSVQTLDDALTALETLSTGGDPDALPTCTAS